MGDKNGYDNDFDKFDTRIDYKYPTSASGSKKTYHQKQRRSPDGGVEYTPSQKAPQRQPQATGSPRSGGTASRPRPSSGAKKKMGPSSQSTMYMAIIVCVGIAICFGAFFLMFQLTKPKVIKTPETDGELIEVSEGETTVEESLLLSQEESDVVVPCVIRSRESGTISMLNAEDDTVFQVFVDSSTAYADKYGAPMTLQEFEPGDLVFAEYTSTNKKVQKIRRDPEAWTKSSIKKIAFDGQATTAKVGNDTFSIPSSVVILPAGTSQIVTADDTVTIKGRKTKILSILVEKRTGTLNFTNKDKIKDGTVEVDTDVYKALDEAANLKLSEGSHTVVVKGSNIDPYIKEITLAAGETVTIDLSLVSPKSGIIALTVNVADYAVTINDEPVAAPSEPIELPFGTYKLKVSKEGFTPWEGTVIVNQPTTNITATLVEEVKTGTVSVVVKPDGVAASVYIDNALVGTAPTKARVTYGSHQLTVKAQGYDDTSTAIVVDSSEDTYQVIMHPTSTQSTNTQTNTNTQTTTDPNADNTNQTLIPVTPGAQ